VEGDENSNPVFSSMHFVPRTNLLYASAANMAESPMKVFDFKLGVGFDSNIMSKSPTIAVNVSEFYN
jgi:hypothetical protein